MCLLQTLCAFAFLFSLAWADLTTATGGSANFDLNSDGTLEMKLTPTGLGVGSTPSTNLQVAGSAIFSNNLYVGTTGGNSSLYIHGSYSLSVESLSANTTLSANNSLIMVSSATANVTLTLPYAGNVMGREYIIKKTTNVNSVFIKAGGNYYIDNYGKILQLTSDGSNYPFVKLVSGANQWYILEQSGNGVGTVASANLVCWLPLDETSGNVAYDYSANLNHGYLTKGDFSSNAITGVIGRCLKLDNNAYVTVPASSASIPYGKRSRSVSMWIKPFDSTVWTSGGNVIFTYGTAAARSLYGWDMHNSPNLRFASYQDDDIFNAGLSSTGEWFHMVTTYDGQLGGNIYINGSWVASSTFGAALTTTSSALSIGTSLAAGNCFYGNLDDFRMYNKKLTDEEINKLYRAGVSTP